MVSLNDKEFQKNLKAAMTALQANAYKGIRLACAYVKLESQKLTPVDEGNLKASAYTSVSIGHKTITGEIGFTANYAAAVHEKPMVHAGEPRKATYVNGQKFKGRGKYWDPQGKGQNKFLEKAFYNNRIEILTIIHKASKL